MSYRIEIKHKDQFTDTRAENLLNIIEEDIGVKLKNVQIVNAYNIFGEYTQDELEILKNELFCDPVFQEGEIGFKYALKLNYDFLIEVSYLSGVTDNVGKTACKGISNILKNDMDQNDVRSSMVYFFSGRSNEELRQNIARKVLSNTLIENYFVYNKKEIKNGRIITYSKPVVHVISEPFYKQINLEISDEELLKLSDDYILSLDLDEMYAIRDYYRKEDTINFRRKLELPKNPTNVEIEVFAQTWSEHCKHKIFNSKIKYKYYNRQKIIDSIFKTYIKGSAEKIRIQG